jgi:His/Glu/Gln/Arg/opine family amino acid ABC transporter permease subunit
VALRVTDDQGRVNVFHEPIVVKSNFFTRLLEVWGIRDAFLRGAWFTIELTVVTTVLGFLLAVVLALMRVSHFWLLKWPAAAYIEIIRGTPLLVQILIAWLVLPFVGLKLPILIAGGLALTVNTSAYQAEAMRAGIQAIPTGQMEASLSLGMSYLQAMRHVILPQAFRLAIPPLGNEFVTLLKDTSLVSVIGVVELTQVARIFSAQTFIVLEAFLGVALIYFVMTYSITTVLRVLERRLAIPGLGLGGGP